MTRRKKKKKKCSMIIWKNIYILLMQYTFDWPQFSISCALMHSLQVISTCLFGKMSIYLPYVHSSCYNEGNWQMYTMHLYSPSTLILTNWININSYSVNVLLPIWSWAVIKVKKSLIPYLRNAHLLLGLQICIW